MNKKWKFSALLFFTLMFGGCASTSQNVAKNFEDGAISNQQQRQQQQASRGSSQDNKFKDEDAVVGIFNVILQGIVDLFSDDKKN